MRHFLEVDDLSSAELAEVLELAASPAPPQVLAGKGAGLVFEKPSARTRNSSEMAVVQLGGHPMYIRDEEVGIDKRESAEDVIRTLARYHSLVAARVYDHKVLERMAACEVVPVVNLLSDEGHPMQALADLVTLNDEFGSLDGLTLTYVGDANNVWRSLALGCAMTGVKSRIACPGDYGPSEIDLDRVRALGGDIEVFDRPEAAVEGVDAIYTDVWTSMGQETEAEARMRAFEGFQVTEEMLGLMSPKGIFMHCLPAHRGEEVSHEAVESPLSRVFPQAENRMHSARGLFAWIVQQ
ncbi:MAG: ornithine carbamoyltransferase [Actinomycetia bacterium]|nr:ornithine carbamoyltransferase [Actinomycetes bacterium]